MMHRYRHRISGRGRAGDERGSVIVIVAGLLLVLMVLLAFTVDLGAGRQAEQQAQTAADAAALAAADSIPAGNASTSNPTVIAAGQAMAATDDPSGSAVVTMPTASSAKVVVSASSPNHFAGLFGVNTEPVSASSVAAENSGSTTTSSASNVAIFANDDSCDGGLTMAGSLLGSGLLSSLLPANSISIPSSTVISNGTIGVNSISFAATNSTVIYGGANKCAYYGTTPSNATKTQSTADYSYPLTFPSSAVPSSCGSASMSLNIGSAALTPGIYCSTSSITLLGIGSNLTLTGVTLIAPTINISSTIGSISSWTPATNAPNNLLAWAESGGLTINLSLLGQINSLQGVLYAPGNGNSINITSGVLSGSGLIEGQQVHLASSAVTFSGTGPSASGPTTTALTPGSSSLSQ